MRTYFSLFVFVLCIGFTFSVKAQDDFSGNPKLVKLKEFYKKNCWLGLGVNGGFSGNNGSSFFSVGIAPQLGFKLNKVLSVGPRLEVNYNYLSGLGSTGQRTNVNLWNLGASGFARANIFNIAFIQAEGGVNRTQKVYYVNNNFGSTILVDNFTNKASKVTEYEYPLLVGAGYVSGNKSVSSEISLFYNLFHDPTTNSTPFVIRVMLSFNYLN